MSKRINKLFLIIVVSVIISVLVLLMIPTDFDNKMHEMNYCTDIICLIISVILYISGLFSKKYDLFSPITFYSFLHIMMFFVAPIYDLMNHIILHWGLDVFAWGIEGSVIALLGYIVFWLVNTSDVRIRQLDVYHNNDRKIADIETGKSKSQLTIIIAMYFFCFAANLYYLMSSGKSPLYIFTLGVMGSAGYGDNTAGIGFISMFSYALPSVTLLYIEYGENNILKIIMFALMFMMQVARGFRFFILQIAFMYVSYYYLRRNKKPKLKEILILSVMVLVPVVIMTMFRNSIRSGMGIDITMISMESVTDAIDSIFWGNFRIYQDYYGVVKAIPEMTGYMYGAQSIVYTAIMLIPRIIWPGKPGNPGSDVQRLVFGNTAVLSGSAFPNLGEYYCDAGVIGVILWMIFFGIVLKWVQFKYRLQRTSEVDLMVYCTVLGCILQFTIRGYMPSNFWMIVMAIMPYWVIKKVMVKKTE